MMDADSQAHGNDGSGAARTRVSSRALLDCHHKRLGGRQDEKSEHGWCNGPGLVPAL